MMRRADVWREEEEAVLIAAHAGFWPGWENLRAEVNAVKKSPGTRSIGACRLRLLNLRNRGLIGPLRRRGTHAGAAGAGLHSKPSAAPPVSKRRKCLGAGCGKTFESEGPGERICKACKNSKAWRRGSLDAPYAVKYG